jgi:two-component system, OmpR family, response regulator
MPYQQAQIKDAAMAAPHVLVVDDDATIRRMVSDFLVDYDMRVTTVSSGREIAGMLERDEVDLIILDLRLPGEDGLAIAQHLRATSAIPIIILTGRTDESDRVMGLELGADDYLTKPFSPRELLARIRALLRRARMRLSPADAVERIRSYRFAGWQMNVRLRQLTSPDGRSVPLSIGEYNLLVAFLVAPQRILGREQLLDLSRLHNAEVFERSVDVQVGRLRKKIETDVANPRLIVTERGVGYRFTAPVEVVPV